MISHLLFFQKTTRRYAPPKPGVNKKEELRASGNKGSNINRVEEDTTDDGKGRPQHPADLESKSRLEPEDRVSKEGGSQGKDMLVNLLRVKLFSFLRWVNHGSKKSQQKKKTRQFLFQREK